MFSFQGNPATNFHLPAAEPSYYCHYKYSTLVLTLLSWIISRFALLFLDMFTIYFHIQHSRLFWALGFFSFSPPPQREKCICCILKIFYLTIGLADFENVISRTGFKSHVLHSLKERAIFLHTCFHKYFSDKQSI